MRKTASCRFSSGKRTDISGSKSVRTCLPGHTERPCVTIGASRAILFKDTVVSLGVPSPAINLVGAAVVLAVDDLKVPLNRSRTLALTIEDAVEEDRSAMVELRFAW